MDYLDFIVNFFNVSDNSSLIKIYFEKFRDSNEYRGERIISFICFVILLLVYIAMIFGIIFLAYYFLK